MKRLICLLLAIALLSIGVSAYGLVQGSYYDLGMEGGMLEYKIGYFLKDRVVFTTCDTIKENGTEMVANPNSSRFAMAEKKNITTDGNGSVAFVKTDSNLADLPIVVRSENKVKLADYQFVEFDLYMGGNWKFYTAGEAPDYYTWIRYQTMWTNSVTDSTVCTYDAQWDFDPYSLRKNGWAHVRMPVPANARGECVQVTIHYSPLLFRGSKGDFVAIDNVQFTNDDADRPLTLADKDEVMAMKAELDALRSQSQGIPVRNGNLLNRWVKQIGEMEAALLKGDVDNDGAVSAADALMVLKSVVGKVTLTDLEQQVADVDANNQVDATDALEILKIIVGK